MMSLKRISIFIGLLVAVLFFPLPASAVNLPFPRVFSVKIFIANQVDPNFATPDNILSKINTKLAQNGINKSFQGEVIVFDQTAATNCLRYPPNIYAPDEFCNLSEGTEVAIAIFHNYPGGGHFNRNVEVGDYSNPDSPYFVLFHELGHLLGFSLHYDDLWSAQETDICHCSYQSPFIGDFMGSGQAGRYLNHAQEIINRSRDLVGSTPPELVQSEIYRDIPDQIKLYLPDGQAVNGQITIYYPDLTNTIGNGHTPMKLLSEKSFQKSVADGILSYSQVNHDYTALSPFWSPYQSTERILLLALLKFETGSHRYFAWLDSAVLQMQYFGEETSTIRFSESTASPTPSIFACPWDLDGDGSVGISDRDYLNLCYAPLSGVAAGCEAADLNNNGVINALDYSILLTHWGNCPVQ